MCSLNSSLVFSLTEFNFQAIFDLTFEGRSNGSKLDLATSRIQDCEPIT